MVAQVSGNLASDYEALQDQLTNPVKGAYGMPKVAYHGTASKSERPLFKFMAKMVMSVTATVLAGGLALGMIKVDNASHAPTPVSASQSQSVQMDAKPASIKHDEHDQVSKLGIEEGATTRDIVHKFLDKGQYSLALAAQMETLRLTPYNDKDWNIGFGYDITKQKAERGEEGVRGDMIAAGIDAESINKLLSGKSKEIKSVRITEEQAVRLLTISYPRYQKDARDWIGHETYDRLTPNKRAAIDWLTYNVGSDNIYGFKRLAKAVKSGDSLSAAKNIAPVFVDPKGVQHKNERAQAVAGSVFAGKPIGKEDFHPEAKPFLAKISTDTRTQSHAGFSPKHDKERAHQIAEDRTSDRHLAMR